MSVLLRYASLRWLQVVLGLALMALMLAPSASGATQLDTATATGSNVPTNVQPCFTFGVCVANISISAQGTTSGQNPSGSVAYMFMAFHGDIFSGPVTCLSVTGPDSGAGTLGSPTTAVINFHATSARFGDAGIVTMKLVDNGGNGLDTFAVAGNLGRAPTDCSPVAIDALNTWTLANGRATVFDALALPTSKDQCKNGGWLNYAQFKNQGQCVRFVETGK